MSQLRPIQIHSNNSPDKIKVIVELAKAGSAEAQFICYSTYALCIDSNPPKNPPEPISLYFHEMHRDMQKSGLKLEHYLPILKDNERPFKKLNRELNRMVYSQLIRMWVKNKTLELKSRDKAEEWVLNHIKKNQIEELKKITSIDVLQHEMKFYTKNFSKWAFHLKDMNFGTVTFQIPSKRTSNTQ